MPLSYDLFISYRHKDNNYDGWVTAFVSDLKKELEATFKDSVSVYFDENPMDGLSEHHDVDLSLKEKVKCLVFIPILSQTYCDPKSFAWKNEFLPFLHFAKADTRGLKVKVANGNVASRILPVRIHDLDEKDKSMLEDSLGGILRAIDFTYKAHGINRPLIKSDKRNENFNKTFYRDQINKVANAVKEIIDVLKEDSLTQSLSQDKAGIFPGSIPVHATTLFGRNKEINDLVLLLGQNRVVSIIGPGGMGKTSLSLELAGRLNQEYEGNCAFVSLSALNEVGEVIPTIANTIGLKEAEGRSLIKGISSFIGNRKALLVIDNLEQVIGVAPQLAEIVSNCPNLKLLTTSRTPLKIRAEVEYALTPLLLPSDQNLNSVDVLMSVPAIAMFVDRAKKVNSTFELTSENAMDVVRICRRLDGLPLALELAAARIRMMSPKQLLQKLEHALDVLTGGSKDLPDRHQTLRATIDWSHSLLGESEKILFRGMAVFSGGFSLEGIEEICGDGSLSAFEGLESLVDKGLIQHLGSSGRFILLQTIKAYALEKLEAANEMRATKLRHAKYYLMITTQIGAGLESEHQLESMQRGILEESNFQSALDFLLSETKNGNAEAAEDGMNICGSLYFFWHIFGKHLIARHYSTSFLDAPANPSAKRARAVALNTAGIASSTLGQSERSIREHTEAYKIAKEINDKPILMFCDIAIFIAYLGLGKIDEASTHAAECMIISLDHGNDFNKGFAYTVQGLLHLVRGQLNEAVENYDQALLYQRKSRDHEGGGLSLGGLAVVASVRGDSDKSIELYREALELFNRIGDRAEAARILEEMAWVFLKTGNVKEARKHFLDSIQAYEEIGSVRGIGLALLGIAGVESTEKHPAKAIEIATAAELFTKQEGVVNFYGEGFQGTVYIEDARKALTENELARAIDTGKKLTVKDALQRAEGSGIREWITRQ